MVNSILDTFGECIPLYTPVKFAHARKPYAFLIVGIGEIADGKKSAVFDVVHLFLRLDLFFIGECVRHLCTLCVLGI